MNATPGGPASIGSLYSRSRAIRTVVGEIAAALSLECTDPAPESCADDGCPVHGEPTAVWVTCEGCQTLVPDGEECGECGRPL
jgi:hypothetical protein